MSILLLSHTYGGFHTIKLMRSISEELPKVHDGTRVVPTVSGKKNNEAKTLVLMSYLRD